MQFENILFSPDSTYLLYNVQQCQKSLACLRNMCDLVVVVEDDVVQLEGVVDHEARDVEHRAHVHVSHRAPGDHSVGVCNHISGCQQYSCRILIMGQHHYVEAH